jgi:hypothetical protein
MSQFRAFGLREAYGAADAVRYAIIEHREEDTIDVFVSNVEDLFPIDAEFTRTALEPQQTTFLHLVIESYLDQSGEYLASKGDPPDVLADFAASFKAHGVATPKAVSAALRRFAGDDEEEDEDSDDAYAVKAGLAAYRAECLSKIATEVFTLLFSDRLFLLELNERLAELVRPLKVAEHPDLLERDGVVKRCVYWPAWLRRALMFRDKGHCALCLSDISGIVAITEEGYHVDHIVPLERGGTNDPTNLQLLCEPCNLKKAAGKARTSSFAMVYW